MRDVEVDTVDADAEDEKIYDLKTLDFPIVPINVLEL